MDANTPAPAALEAQLHAARAGVAAALGPRQEQTDEHD